MFEWPMGVTNLILLVGWCFLLLAGRLKGVVYGARHWRLSGMTLFLATFSSIIVLISNHHAENKFNSIIDFTAQNNLFIALILIMAVLGHMNIRFEKHRLELELAPISILFVFVSIQMVSSGNLFVYALGAPFLYLVASISSFMDRDSNLSKATNLPIVGAVILTILICLSLGLFYSQFGTLDVKKLSSLFILPAQRLPFLFGWTGVFVGLCMLILRTPFDAVVHLLRQSGSWSIALFFGLINSLTGAILLQKWVHLLEKSGLLGQIFEDGWPGPFPRLGLSLGVLVLLWTSVVLFTHRRAGSVFLAWLLVPTASLLFADGLGTNSATAWSYCMLLLFTISSNLVVKNFADLDINMNETTEEVTKRLAQAPAYSRLQVIFGLLMSTPLCGYAAFALVAQTLSSWTQHPFDSATGIEIFVVTTLLITVAALMANQYFMLSRLMMIAEHGGKQTRFAWAHHVWNSMLFFPVLIIGLHPVPLYKNILAYISK